MGTIRMFKVRYRNVKADFNRAFCTRSHAWMSVWLMTGSVVYNHYLFYTYTENIIFLKCVCGGVGGWGGGLNLTRKGPNRLHIP